MCTSVMRLLVCKSMIYLNQKIANSSSGQDCIEDWLLLTLSLVVNLMSSN